jgi:hypothetical protein
VPAQRVAHGTGVGDAVDVAALQRCEAGVESVGRQGRPAHHDVVGKHPAETADQRRARLAVRPARQPCPRLRVEVGVHDLTAGVDARVGAAGNRHAYGLGAAQHRGERRGELALDGAQAWLGGPAGEVRAVVGEVDPHPQRGGSRVARTRLLAHRDRA